MTGNGKYRRASLAWFSGVLFLPLTAAGLSAQEEAQDADKLKHELDSMKVQLRALEDKMKQQEGLIDELSKKKAPPPQAPAPAKQFTSLTAETPPPEGEAPPAADQDLEERITQKVLEQIQPSLAAANKTFPSQFNPAIGLILDTAFSWKEHQHSNFEFRSAELGLSANIDPFARGYALINATADAVEVEEAAIVTTTLPYNLTLKGGRFFADFGRLSHFHDHELPFVNRPVVLDQFVGGESQADGAELSYLFPFPQYLTLTLGAYNKLGGENDRADNAVARDLGKFTMLVRPATFFNLSDSSSVDLGVSYAITPKVEKLAIDDTTGDITGRDNKIRHLVGADITYRYTPLSQAQYRGFVWGTELLYNNEDFNVGDGTDPVFRGRDAWGMYTYGEVRLTRRYYPGFLFDYAQDLSREGGETTAYSPYFTIWLSEFNRLRLQYTYLDEPSNHESQFFVQWTAILGSHVHGFRDR